MGVKKIKASPEHNYSVFTVSAIFLNEIKILTFFLLINGISKIRRNERRHFTSINRYDITNRTLFRQKLPHCYFPVRVQ